MGQLDRYPFSGHGVILGKHEQDWQNVEEVLLHFGKRVDSARRRYRGFIVAGIDEGRRDDLTGGGLIRSAGGWSAVRDLRESMDFGLCRALRHAGGEHTRRPAVPE